MKIFKGVMSDILTYRKFVSTYNATQIMHTLFCKSDSSCSFFLKYFFMGFYKKSAQSNIGKAFLEFAKWSIKFHPTNFEKALTDFRDWADFFL